MQDRSPAAPDPQRLPESLASRLFARASELDAAHAAAAEVAALRTAALEAGISPRAFDAALAELRDAEAARVPEVSERPRRRSWKWPLAATVAALLTVSTYAVGRVIAPAEMPTAIETAMVEEALLLQCLTPGEAATLIRPLLDDPANTVETSPDAPRAITIRATPTQVRDVKALLEKVQAPGSPVCARP